MKECPSRTERKGNGKEDHERFPQLGVLGVAHSAVLADHARLPLTSTPRQLPGHSKRLVCRKPQELQLTRKWGSSMLGSRLVPRASYTVHDGGLRPRRCYLAPSS